MFTFADTVNARCDGFKAFTDWRGNEFEYQIVVDREKNWFDALRSCQVGYIKLGPTIWCLIGGEEGGAGGRTTFLNEAIAQAKKMKIKSTTQDLTLQLNILQKQ